MIARLTSAGSPVFSKNIVLSNLQFLDTATGAVKTLTIASGSIVIDRTPAHEWRAADTGSRRRWLGIHRGFDNRR